jgi:hypothetical protein
MPRVAPALLAAAVVLVLSACVDAGSGPTLPGESPSPAPTPTTTSEPTAAPTEGADPLDVDCADLVDADAVYAFDPNFVLRDSWSPAAGSPAEEALAAGGVACQLVRETGGGTIDLSVARLTAAEITAKKNEAFAESTMVPTYGEEAYFEVADGIGTAIVFQGDDWLVISSSAFAEPGEPTEIIDAALAAL